MYCTNCGAKIDDTAISCAFCNAVNPIAAESEYMEKLEDIRNDIKQLPAESARNSNENFKNKSIKAIRIFLVTGCICVLISLSCHLLNTYISWKADQSNRKIIAFEKQYFPILDQYYESGSEDELLEYALSLTDQPGSAGLYLWSHGDYLRDLINNMKN